MNAIPGIAASGFSAEQIAALTASSSYSGCAGLTRDQMSNITAAAYAGFTSNCISLISSASFSDISANQVSSWAPQACSGIY